jgi:aspartate aminotransferase
MSELSERVLRITASATMRVAATVERLRREGVAVIDFGAGEPDFGTPTAATAAAHGAIDEGFTKYTVVPGIVELRQAICDRYRKDYAVEYSPAQVVVTAGGKQALFNTAMALFGRGDEVITHGPYWPTLTEQIRLVDATPVVVRTRPEDGFALTAELLLSALTSRTKAIIINSPSNPTGAVISEADMAVIAKEAARHGLWIVLDLCYEKLIYDRRPHNLPGVLAKYGPDRAVLCGSASKAYAMTGWRCGWSIAPAAVATAQAAVQSHMTSNVSSISQKAALAALTGPQEIVGEMLQEYGRRRDHLCEWLSVEPALRFHRPAGAFYLFVDVRALCSTGAIRSSAGLADALLDEERVAVTPGEAFDAPGFVRISYATSMDNLREGSRRLLAFVARLQQRAVTDAPIAHAKQL